MIYTVTLNPALDYVIRLDELRTDDINRSQGEELSYGGKGINVSYILTQLGVESRALGFLAGFTGEYVEQLLKRDGVDTDFIHLKNGATRINVKIKAQKELDINASGPEITEEAVAQLIDKLSSLREGDTLVLAGSIPPSLPDDIYERILEQLSVNNIDTVVDTTGELLLRVLRFRPFMIKPNHIELGELFGVEIKSPEDVEKYAKRLQEMGARNVLVSRGKDGAMLIDENGEVNTMGNVPGKIKSSVGCGDSMVAGFIAGYLKSHDYHYALRLGSVCGNATAFSYTLADRQQLEEMMDNDIFR